LFGGPPAHCGMYSPALCPLPAHDVRTLPANISARRPPIGSRERGKAGMAMLYVVAFVGTFIIAVSVFRMTATEQPSVTAVPIPSAKAAEPVSKATTDPVASADIPSTKAAALVPVW